MFYKIRGILLLFYFDLTFTTLQQNPKQPPPPPPPPKSQSKESLNTKQRIFIFNP
ncbi:hypothetical protein HanIR_Chr17g0898231 [Helianthus annuus]|nr:hypothetical protein HanIR_Chr17g0898231 [Helianthus annuus]